jgi:hypothetical protein
MHSTVSFYRFNTALGFLHEASARGLGAKILIGLNRYTLLRFWWEAFDVFLWFLGGLFRQL